MAWQSRAASKQGLRVLGVPVGHPSYILAQLEQKADEHKEFLRIIPVIQDVQSAWLLLLYCAAPRANYWLRTVQPDLTAPFAKRHDKDVWTCLCEILQINGVRSNVVSSASLPLTLGRVGLGTSLRIREAANWVSWADCLEMVRERHPSIATAMIEGIIQKSQGYTRVRGSHRRSTLEGWDGDALLDGIFRERPTRQPGATGTRPHRVTARVAEGGVHCSP